LGIDRDFFDDHTLKPTSQLRLLHYPSNRYSVGTQFGIKPHTDFECFTILYQEIAGLQVIDGNNQWIDVPAMDDAFVVTIGDVMEVLSNGHLRATMHRVLNTGKERFSMAFFFALDYDTVVTPMGKFVSEANPPTYLEMVAGQHLENFTIKACKHLRRKLNEGSLVLNYEPVRDNPFKRNATE